MLLDGVTVGAGTHDQRLDHRPRRDDRRALPHRGRRRARRGGQDRVGKHACGRRAYLPGRGASRRSDQVLSTTVDLTRERDRRGRLGAASSTTSSACPTSCATRCGGSSRPTSSRTTLRAAWSSPGWADRRSAARWPARRSATAPRGRSCSPAATPCPRWTTPDTTVLCASYSGNTEETLAVYEAARRARRAADRRHDRRQARRGGARRRRPGDPAPGRLPAARRGRLLARGGARGGRAVRRRRAAPRRDRRGRRARRAARRDVGPGRARRLLAKELARGLHGTIPQIAGAGLTAPIAYRWKTQINENAKTPALRRTSCPSSTTTRSSAGRAPASSAASAPCSSTTPTCTRGSASGSS